MPRSNVIQPLSEHAILFILPVLLIGWYAGLLKFKAGNERSDIRLPVYHSYDFGDLTDYDIATVYADNRGSVSLQAGQVPPQESSFVLPADYFSLNDTDANNLRSLQLRQYINDTRSKYTRTRLVLHADGRLPYVYLKQLLSAICGPAHHGWHKMYWTVNWQR